MERVLVVVSGYKPAAEALAKKIEMFLKDKNFEPVFFSYDGYSVKVQDTTLDLDYAFIISLGGDGNVLFAARLAGEKNIPVVPINFGQFGFIANIQPEEWETALEDFLQGRQEKYVRMLLKVEVFKDKKKFCEFLALNEAVVSGSGVAKLITLELSYNDLSFGTFRADGVIVASPTGSTAYAVAAGGPILDPTLNVVVIAPIAPFTLSNRPIVLPSSGSLTMTVLPQRQQTLILSIDGQESVSLSASDEVRITQSEKSVNLVGCSQRHFYEALRAKLGWSGSFHFEEQ